MIESLRGVVCTFLTVLTLLQLWVNWRECQILGDHFLSCENLVG